MPPILTRLDVRGATGDLRNLLPAPEVSGDGPDEVVREVLDKVRAGGDASVRELTERFDHVRVEELAVPAGEVAAAVGRIAPELRTALEVARDNVEAFHRAELPPDVRYEADGVVVDEIRRAVDRAGLYIPGGRAPLASTVIMTAVPARVAGVEQLVMCSPPGPDGTIADVVLAAAAIAGVDEVYRVGGAQAIGAMAYGTETIAPVDVICGPGNRYVAAAQRIVSQQGAVGVPSAFAGPSEVVVVADETTDVEWAAVDLVVQAEHGPDGLAWLITWSDAAVESITAAVERITAASPRREEIASTLARGGYAVVVDGPEQAMAVANVVAAEHLEIMTADPGPLVAMVRSAGAVFTGRWSPASVGDYVAGPSHVLPTARSARFGSALGTTDFHKRIHVVAIDRPALERLAPHVAALARAEGLVAHADSVLWRTRERG